MNLFLWRHALAYDQSVDGLDVSRELTPRGREQAELMSQWLIRHLPSDSKIICSSAKRCVQTARVLGLPYDLDDRLLPDATIQEMIEVVNGSLGIESNLITPSERSTLVIGHQPTLGQLIGLSLGCAPVAVRKASVWWLRARERNGKPQIVIEAVIAPDTL
jgi:phosphohistidine phosphatase